ncbi:MAG: STAS domain-containing protein [Methanothrix sp.]|jgi:anti-sigma B factor antagonist|nr:STAS domain-containing protein [Methanothrix sp.]
MKIMKITEKNINDIEVIAISGRIDVISAKDLETFIDGIIDNNSRIVFDLEDTEYISSSGLRVFLATLKRLKKKNGEMRLASPQPIIRNILDISGLSSIFVINHNLKDALDSFDSKR